MESERATTHATFCPSLHPDTEAEMKPLQVWLPAFDAEVLTDALWRDLGRTQQQWRGETTVWLLPGLREAMRWETPERPWSTELAIPAETLNRIDVFHIGDNGYLHGSGRYPRFFSASTDNLLDSWLNLLDNSEEHGIQLRSCPTKIPFEVPRFEQNRVFYSDLEVEIGPAEAMPIKVASQEERRIEGRWPPPGFPLPTISPSAESRLHAGSMSHVGYVGQDDGIPVYEHTSEGKQHRCASFLGEWPEPFTYLFPLGGGQDAMLCQVRTKEIAKISQDAPDAALRQAKDYSGRFIAEGHAFFKDFWFHPRINKTSVEDALSQLELHCGLSLLTIEEACDSREFQEKMGETVIVRRAIGVQGLIWSLLINRLEDRLPFRSCTRCGRIISHRKGKEFCGPEESSSCFKGRRAADKRRERKASVGG